MRQLDGLTGQQQRILGGLFGGLGSPGLSVLAIRQIWAFSQRYRSTSRFSVVATGANGFAAVICSLRSFENSLALLATPPLRGASVWPAFEPNQQQIPRFARDDTAYFLRDLKTESLPSVGARPSP